VSKNEWHERTKPKSFRLRTYGPRHEARSVPAHERPIYAPMEPASTRTPLVGFNDARNALPKHAPLPGLQIGRSDYLELGGLTMKYQAATPASALTFLERELSRALVVDDRSVPSDVATLRSQVAFHDEETGRDWVVTLAHPADFFGRDDAISVMSPLGAALIGLSEGQSIEFNTADGRSRRVGLVRVLCQPRRLASRRATGSETKPSAAARMAVRRLGTGNDWRNSR
jgi:regulator of nucleoside diphosphate kinase